MHSHFNEFVELLKHPVKFRMFLFMKIPSAFFSGVRIKNIDEKHCEVTVPFKWFSQNPFRSTYFACLSMAAEMSTGALAMAHLHKRKPTVSMLVVKTEGEYFKKATGKTSFVCREGEMIKQTIEESILTSEGKAVTVRSTGKNDDGDIVAEFKITWSFKSRSNSKL